MDEQDRQDGNYSVLVRDLFLTSVSLLGSALKLIIYWFMIVDKLKGKQDRCEFIFLGRGGFRLAVHWRSFEIGCLKCRLIINLRADPRS